MRAKGHHLVLGGTRSGKSAHAERLALACDARRWCYIATAQAGDDEMAERIAHHRATRDARWETVEAPLHLGATLQMLDDPQTCVLIDCLTLWLSNALAADCWADERAGLLDALAVSQAQLIMVSNEVGSGIVPLGQLSRRFADEAGRLHQDLAARCAQATLVVAGLPLILKDNPE